MSEQDSQPITFEDYVEQGQHKLAKQLLNAATLQQDTDRLMAAAKEAAVDVVELADGLRQKYGLKGSMEGIYEQVVAFGSLHKRTSNWNDRTFYMSAEHAEAATGSGTPEKGHVDVVSLGGSSAAGDSQKDKSVAADLERMRQEMEAMKLIMEKQVQTIQEPRAAKTGPQLRKVVFVPEAGRKLEANVAKPDWARALAGVPANWASDNVQSMLDSEYEAAIGALSEVWSHVLFEVEKEEVKALLSEAPEQQRQSKPRSSETKPADKPKTGKVAPQHVQDRRNECAKDRFTNMGTPEETYESKGGKVLKTGKPPRQAGVSLRRLPCQALVVPMPRRERLMEGGPRRLGVVGGKPRGRTTGGRGAHTWEGALHKLERLQWQDALHSWQTLVLVGWEDSSLGTYKCHLRRLVAVEGRFPHDTAERVLEHTLLESTRLGKSESTLKGVISAATMAGEVWLADASIRTTI